MTSVVPRLDDGGAVVREALDNVDRHRQTDQARLAAAVRRVIAVATANRASGDVVDDAVARLDAVVDALAPHAAPSRYPDVVGSAAERLKTFVTHPVMGPGNPLAPPLVVRVEGTRVLADVEYGIAYEGPQGFVQGGVVAAGFDVVLAMAAGVNGRLGMTRSLTVRYLAPTPLGVPLRYAAGIALEDRRRTTVDGVLLAGDMVVAEATGEFVMPRPA